MANVTHDLHAQRRPEEFNRCTAQRRNGRFCDEPSLPEAPFPICVHHASEILRHLAGYIGEFKQLPPALRMIATDHVKSDEQVNRAVDGWRAAPDETVYYLRVGKLIKIGTTENLRRRLTQYPPGSELLAIEPGGENLEHRRHCEFRASLAERKEWFVPSPELIAHVNRLRKQQKSPPIAP
ncbi:GIY-YIG nuclease family protein [Amycolatopsis sp. CFH S0078]|uniref:GIY-YIG nuclease family protein n=1 Tax=Amycolatopsis sp. CFH S0078 TaxID=1644108 RepID=UPI00196AA410|nr:GIY-YIG nuclease family protein [Amycolatopsis sp. CFH S0078]